MDFKLISDPSVSTFLYLEVHEVPLFFVLTFAVQQLLDITQRFVTGPAKINHVSAYYT